MARVISEVSEARNVEPEKALVTGAEHPYVLIQVPPANEDGSLDVQIETSGGFDDDTLRSLKDVFKGLANSI